MKHYRPILAAAILSAAIGFHTNDSYAQNYGYPEGKNAADLIREDTLRTGNNHHIYEYVDLYDTRAPKGYKAFYISHYGRHGSRTDHRGNEAWVVLEKELRPAYEAGILSWKGRQAYEKIVEMCEVGDGMREMLTPVGVKEHKEIARRMYRRFREVFRQSKEVEARSSTVQRCVLSMGAFCTALAAEDPKLDIDLLTGQRYMDYIAHTTGYGEATAGSVKMLKAYKKAHPRDTVSFFALMFNDPAEGRAFIKDAYHFESNLIECANYCQCLGVEDVFHRCMPFEVYYDAWSLKNRSLYLVHCNSAEFGDKRIPIGKPLVDDIIAKADAAVAGN
ncbi:MAG: histidine-type phosphatase, partial [Candidatus Cryptobacteroides sp.]|nr:histidine-type phosphatase [Candidatus Cryptobacteroides sp.]